MTNWQSTAGLWRREALLLMAVLPALIFIICFFLWPISLFLARGVTYEDVRPGLDRTMTVLTARANLGALPDDIVLRAFFGDLKNASPMEAGRVARILSEGDGRFRAAFGRLSAGARTDPEPANIRDWFAKQNELWLEPKTWLDISSRTESFTVKYLSATAPWYASSAVNDGGLYAINYPEIYSRTVFISVVVCLLTLFLGLPVAWLLTAASPKWALVILIAVLIPFWSSILVRTLSWIVIFQREGVLNSLFLSLGLVSAPLDLLKTRIAVIVGMLHVLLPYMILTLYDGIKKIPSTQFRAAMSLGATPLSALRYVYLPQLRPAIVAGLTIVFTLNVGFYLTPLLLGGAKDQLIGYYAAFFAQKSGNWQLAGAISLWLIALTAAIVLLLTLLSRSNVSRLPKAK